TVSGLGGPTRPSARRVPLPTVLLAPLLPGVGSEDLVHDVLDLVGRHQLLLEVTATLMELAGRQPLADLIFERLAGQVAGRVLAVDLDDVEAELGLDRLADLAGLELEGGVGELVDHAIGREDAEVA